MARVIWAKSALKHLGSIAENIERKMTVGPFPTFGSLRPVLRYPN